MRLNLLYVHLVEQGRRKQVRNALMFAFYAAETAAGREVSARALVAVGGVTYDAARKALLRYRRGQTPPAIGGGLAPKTVRNVHVMLRGALSDAVRWNLLPPQPSRRRPAAPRPPPYPQRVVDIGASDLRRARTAGPVLRAGCWSAPPGYAAANLRRTPTR